MNSQNPILRSMKTIYVRWMKYMHLMGDIIARILLTIVFMTLVLPIGIIRRIGGDPLKSKSGSKGWIKKPEIKNIQESARRQF